jgi:hypothetical protein
LGIYETNVLRYSKGDEMTAITGKTMLTFFVENGADKARIIQETARTVTIEVVMTRAAYEGSVERHLQLDAPKIPGDWTGELRGIEKVGEHNAPSVQTGGGTYRYTILIFKL